MAGEVITPDALAWMVEQTQLYNMAARDSPFPADVAEGQPALPVVVDLYYKDAGVAQEAAVRTGVPWTEVLDAVRSIEAAVQDSMAHGGSLLDRIARDVIAPIGNYTAEHPAILLAPIAIAAGLPALASAGGAIGGAAGGTAATSLLHEVVGTIVDQSSGLGDALMRLLETALKGLLGGSAQSVRDLSSVAIQNFVSANSESNSILRAATSSALDSIASTNVAAQRSLDTSVGRIFDVLSDVVRRNSDTITDSQDRAIDAISKILNHTVSVEDAVMSRIGDGLLAHLDEGRKHDAEVADAIKRGLDEQIAQSRANADAAQRDLTAAIGAITADADSALATTRDAIVGTGHAQIEATRDAGTEVATATSQGLEGVRGTLDKIAGSTIDDAEVVELGNVTSRIINTMRLAGCPEDLMAFIEQFMKTLFGTFTVDRLKAEVGLLMNVHAQLIEPVIAVLANCAAQAAATLVPTSLPGAPDLREQLRRGLVTEQEARNNLMRQGFTLERAEALLAVRRTLPEVGLLQAWMLRGFIDTNTTIKGLAALGFAGDDIDHLIKMAFFIPPVQDLITMSVREVFTPAIAEKYGQFEDFPESFASYAGLQGVSREWAERYWAAHWSLPSPTQGFEMFQRKIISRADLNTLLRSLDIMPYWRDRLVQLAYRPLPRVDTRRLHAVGLLTDDQLPGIYESYGFSPEHSKLMAEFTKRLNKPAASENVTELKGITRALALTLYDEGIITEDQAREALTQAKVSKGAQNILLQKVKFEREIKERKAKTALIIDQAKAGTITFADAHGQLSALQLTATELQRAMIDLDRARATSSKLPSKSDLDKLLSAKVIRDDEYLSTVQLLGYSEHWAQKFLELAHKS